VNSSERHALNRTAPHRRSLLALGGAGLATALSGAFGAVAKKGKKHKKKCKKPKPGPTCPGACPDTCHLCATRSEGSPVCGDLITLSCANLCTADNDCVGKVHKGTPVPYCITGYTTSSGGVATLGCDGACAGLTPCQ
jgi:hypothetical protein